MNTAHKSQNITFKVRCCVATNEVHELRRHDSPSYATISKIVPKNVQRLSGIICGKYCRIQTKLIISPFHSGKFLEKGRQKRKGGRLSLVATWMIFDAHCDFWIRLYDLRHLCRDLQISQPRVAEELQDYLKQFSLPPLDPDPVNSPQNSQQEGRQQLRFVSSRHLWI